MNDSYRGTGRTTRAVQHLLKMVVDGAEPKMGFYVVTRGQMDDFIFRIIAQTHKDRIKQYSMSNRMVLFNNDARIRFVNWDDPYLMPLDPRGDRWKMSGYRPGLPIVWDHAAQDAWTEREMARNKPSVGRPEKKR